VVKHHEGKNTGTILVKNAGKIWLFPIGKVKTTNLGMGSKTPLLCYGQQKVIRKNDGKNDGKTCLFLVWALKHHPFLMRGKTS
jgi:hypothetical protein